MKESEDSRSSLITSHISFTTALFGFFLFDLFLLYSFFTQKPINREVIANICANVGMVLIGLSFSLSGLSHFYSMFRKFIVYRKDLGLVGFAFVLTHSVILFWFLPQGSLHALDYFNSAHTIPFGSALIALFIFSAMAAISNKVSAHILGGKWWKFLLRLGYFAYILAVIHITFNSASLWVGWYKTGLFTPPPLSLITTFFSLFVLALRIILQIDLSQSHSDSTL